ncbi:MAG: hypothetical protein J0I29_14915 [Rhizobiales bacterium]|nr:hypothetical protein [Hyphomicrobiales bacterium]
MAGAEQNLEMREILLRKAEALRALAESEDWLSGIAAAAALPGTTPATQAAE